MSSNRPFPRKVVIALAAMIVLAAIVLPRFMPGAAHEARGTVTNINPVEREVSVEVIDPANGTTREFTGVVKNECAITINGRPASFGDLRVDDTVQVRAKVEHNVRGSDGKRKNRLTAEWIDITRPEEKTP